MATSWARYYNRGIPGRGAGTIFKQPDYSGLFAQQAKLAQAQMEQEENKRAKLIEQENKLLEIKGEWGRFDNEDITNNLNTYVEKGVAIMADDSLSDEQKRIALYKHKMVDGNALMNKMRHTKEYETEYDLAAKLMAADPNLIYEPETKDEVLAQLDQDKALPIEQRPSPVGRVQKVAKNIDLQKNYLTNFRKFAHEKVGGGPIQNPDGTITTTYTRELTQNEIDDFNKTAINNKDWLRQAGRDLRTPDNPSPTLEEKQNYIKSFSVNAWNDLRSTMAVPSGISIGINTQLPEGGKVKREDVYPVKYTRITTDETGKQVEQEQTAYYPTASQIDLSGSNTSDLPAGRGKKINKGKIPGLARTISGQKPPSESGFVMYFTNAPEFYIGKDGLPSTQKTGTKKRLVTFTAYAEKDVDPQSGQPFQNTEGITYYIDPIANEGFIKNFTVDGTWERIMSNSPRQTAPTQKQTGTKTNTQGFPDIDPN